MNVDTKGNTITPTIDVATHRAGVEAVEAERQNAAEVSRKEQAETAKLPLAQRARQFLGLAERKELERHEQMQVDLQAEQDALIKGGDLETSSNLSRINEIGARLRIVPHRLEKIREGIAAIETLRVQMAAPLGGALSDEAHSIGSIVRSKLESRLAGLKSMASVRSLPGVKGNAENHEATVKELIGDAAMRVFNLLPIAQALAAVIINASGVPPDAIAGYIDELARLRSEAEALKL